MRLASFHTRGEPGNRDGLAWFRRHQLVFLVWPHPTDRRMRSWNERGYVGPWGHHRRFGNELCKNISFQNHQSDNVGAARDRTRRMHQTTVQSHVLIGQCSGQTGSAVDWRDVYQKPAMDRWRLGRTPAREMETVHWQMDFSDEKQAQARYRYLRHVRRPASHQHLEQWRRVIPRDEHVSAVDYQKCNPALQLGIVDKGCRRLSGIPTFGIGIDHKADAALTDMGEQKEAMTSMQDLDYIIRCWTIGECSKGQGGVSGMRSIFFNVKRSMMRGWRDMRVTVFTRSAFGQLNFGEVQPTKVPW